MNQHKCHILLAEDSAAEIDLLMMACREAGLEELVTVTYARDGEEAIEALKQSTLYDLLLLDLNMPRVPGKEVLHYISKSDMVKPFTIVMSNSEYGLDVADSYTLGADAYVVKPLHFEELQKFCTVIKNSWQLYNAINPEYLKANYRVLDKGADEV